MSTITTMIAGAALTLGAGVAFSQQPDAPVSDNAATPAEPAQPADPATPAQPADGNGTDASPAQPADAAEPATAAVPADNTEDADSEDAAKLAAKERKAKRKAQCLAINVGKPRNC